MRRRLAFIARKRYWVLGVGAVISAGAALAFIAWQLSGPLDIRAYRIANAVTQTYLVARDIPYRHVGEWTGRADIYRGDGDGPFPTIVFFHGGGWVYGGKSDVDGWTLPLLASGYALVAVNYRLTDIALAPAAVEDARCAVAWVAANAPHYRLDPTRIVTAGTSAGGHLALMAGLMDSPAGETATCGRAPVKAVVNFAGITDVATLLRAQLKVFPDGWPFVVDWLGQGADRMALAERMSPVTWVDPGDPPVFSVHGTADSLVPFDQATTLHRALERVHVENELMALPGREHGDLSIADLAEMARRVQAFLDPKLRSAVFPMTYGPEWIGASPALPYNAVKSGCGARAFS